MKIVVRIPNWIGDVLFALPALDSLQAAHPKDEIWLAGSAWAQGLLAGREYADRMIPLPSRSKWTNFRASARWLKDRRFDAGLLLTNSFSSALLFAAAGIPERWGYRGDGRGLFLTKSIPKRTEDPPLHMVHFYLRLIENLGRPILAPDIKLRLPAGQRERGRARLADSGVDLEKPLVILHPGAAFGPAKRWPPRRFAELGRLLQEKKGAALAITGTEADGPIAEEMSSALPAKPANLAGRTTLPDLLGVISQAAVFITNDTGPMHIANALRVPTIGIFGPTDPRVTAPFHSPSSVVRKADVPCWPCLNRDCPFDHRCMLGITAAEVFQTAAAYLP